MLAIVQTNAENFTRIGDRLAQRDIAHREIRCLASMTAKARAEIFRDLCLIRVTGSEVVPQRRHVVSEFCTQVDDAAISADDTPGFTIYDTVADKFHDGCS